jgi:DNA-directed RNA polymerase
MSETRRRTAARFNKHNRLVNDKNRQKQFIHTPLGRELTLNEFLKPLVIFLAGERDEKPEEPPKFLRDPIRRLNNPVFLALTALVHLLDSIFRDDRDDPSWEAALAEKVGDDIYRELRKKVPLPYRWGAKDREQAGDWLIRQAMALTIFGYDEDGLPCISDIDNVERLSERLIETNPVWMPLLNQPQPWTGWRKTIDGFTATFVRDPETSKAIEDAFVGYFEHAEGVNALARVPLKIDPDMLQLAERFAVELMEYKRAPGVAAKILVARSEKHTKFLEARERAQCRTDRNMMALDASVARWIGERTFWNDINCDWRGRLYPLPHLNFGRADHIRSLFKFANGLPLGGDPYWLKIHAANCWGLDKKSRNDRIKWVDEHQQDIIDIAADPVGTFEKWKDADSPFCFVAACRELAGAWNDPNFVTHLPVGFDGSANGTQHLSLLIDDFNAGGEVNLWSDELLLADDTPSDVYGRIIQAAIKLIEADHRPHADWWRECFERLDRVSDKLKRKLLKTPIVAFGYSGKPGGRAKDISEVYYELGHSDRPAKGAFLYLAEQVYEAWGLVLPGPKSVMDCICEVAERCAEKGLFMEWVTPSSLPVANRYYELNMIKVSCLRGSERIAQRKIADGVTDEIDVDGAVSGSAPNFVHSLDAAHLIKTVNAAVSEGITDLLTVHDCFYCLAPQASRLHKIISEQLGGYVPKLRSASRPPRPERPREPRPCPAQGHTGPIQIV